MATGKGHNHYVQIGREATWGSAAAATRKMYVVSTDSQSVRGKVVSDVLTGNRNPATIFSGPQKGIATIEFEADYEGQLHLWDAALGTATFGSNGGTSSGTGPYTWTFIQRLLASSYSLQIVTDIPSGKCDRIVGAKLNRLRFSGTTGADAKPFRLSTEWLGKSYSLNVSPTGALSANSPLAIMPGHLDTANLDTGTSDAAGSDRLRSFELSIDNKLAERFYGADEIDEPLYDDYAETTMKWTVEFSTETAINEYLQHASQSPVIKFASGTKSIQFAFGAGYIVEPVGRPIDRWGILTQSFTTRAIHSGSTGLTVTIVNSESTIS